MRVEKIEINDHLSSPKPKEWNKEKAIFVFNTRLFRGELEVKYEKKKMTVQPSYLQRFSNPMYSFRSIFPIMFDMPTPPSKNKPKKKKIVEFCIF